VTKIARGGRARYELGILVGQEDSMHSPAKPLAFTLDELKSYLAHIFPQIWSTGAHEIEAIGPLSARVRLVFHPDHLRPGGTISGPSLFALADLALYVAILAQIGRVPLAVTTNLNINFLRKPAPGDVIGEARLMKLGKRLAVGEVALHSVGEAAMVAHATGTYSIPARGDADTVS
jgi:uncharacterized protein (TIGR00369 family)